VAREPSTGATVAGRQPAPRLTAEQRPALPPGKQLLFCVGAQKAGTTWLAANLDKSPECHFYPFEKELHYFNTAHSSGRGMRAWKARVISGLLADADDLDPEAYAARLRRVQCELDLMKILERGEAGARAWMRALARGAGEARYLCDFTPDYALVPPAAWREMVDYVSAEGRRPKFIFILRDPVDRYWSFLRMMIRHREVPLPEAEARLSDWLAHDLAQGNLSRRNHCDYRYTMHQLDAFVPPEYRLILFYEKMFAPDAFARVCAFLGIAGHAADPGTRVHEGLDFVLPRDRWHDLRTALDDIYAFAFERFGAEVPEYWHRAGPA